MWIYRQGAQEKVTKFLKRNNSGNTWPRKSVQKYVQLNLGISTTVKLELFANSNALQPPLILTYTFIALETSQTRINFYFPWLLELSRFNCSYLMVNVDLNRCAQRRTGQCFSATETASKPYWLWASAKRYINSNWLTGYKETDVRTIYGMEHLFGTHVR